MPGHSWDPRRPVMMCSSTSARAEAARQERLTAHGCATVCSAFEKDVAANPAVWDRNSRGPGSGHYPIRHQLEPLNRPRPWTLDGPTKLDLGQATGTDLAGTPVQRLPQERRLKLVFSCGAPLLLSSLIPSASYPHVPQ
ncbi:hypothetical protein MTO96_012526 [Rhipicephalus appendiculatus]